MMTRKHYIAFANMIADIAPQLGPGRTVLVANKMADTFEADNERFDRDRFMEAATGQNADDAAREAREVEINERNEDRHGTMADAKIADELTAVERQAQADRQRARQREDERRTGQF